MKRLLAIALMSLISAIGLAQTICTSNCSVVAGQITVHWNAVTVDINNNSLVGQTVTYKVYGSQGCGTKTLQATTTQTSA